MSQKLLKYSLFFYSIIVIQSIICMQEKKPCIHRDHVEEILTTKDHIQQQISLRDFLKKHPELISTNHMPGIEYAPGQTLAHFLANKAHSHLLITMFDAGETATAQIPQYRFDDPKFTRCAGSTAFLCLCFQIKKCSDRRFNSFLTIMDKFLKRTPSLAITPRFDGMTPAMAIAVGNSHLQFQALQMLIRHNGQAFEGITNRGNSLKDIIIRTPATPESQNALNLILYHDQTNPNLASELLQIQGNCEHQQEKYPYLPIISRYLFTLTQQSFNRIDQNEQCLCCMNECFCCINPHNKMHYEFWQNFYLQNPDYPNAQLWLQQRFNTIQTDSDAI